MESEERTQLVWQPLTPAGVAAFAGASFKLLWLVQFVVAILAALVVAWLLYAAWFPVVQSAVRKLPTQGMVRAGRLTWDGDSPVKLAQNRFLGIAVDLRHEGSVRSAAHVQVEFGQTDVVVLSLLGALQTPYPRHYVMAFNRDQLEPWWGAWSPFILALAAGSVLLGLMLTWALLALIYAPCAWLLAFFANRELSFAGSYRLCGAALMPAALFMTLTLAFYGLGALDLLALLLATAAHFAVGWCYVLLGCLWRPRVKDASLPAANPFKSGAEPRP